MSPVWTEGLGEATWQARRSGQSKCEIVSIEQESGDVNRAVDLRLGKTHEVIEHFLQPIAPPDHIEHGHVSLVHREVLQMTRGFASHGGTSGPSRQRAGRAAADGGLASPRCDSLRSRPARRSTDERVLPRAHLVDELHHYSLRAVAFVSFC